jgi:uncharacterized protein (DUF433 family)
MRKANTPPPRYRVGDRVRFPFPSQTAEGVIVEDRGGLGVGGRRLYGIRFRWGEEDSYIELPEEEITVHPRRVVSGGRRVAGCRVEADEAVCGGAARIRNTRFTVWGLVEWRQLGLSDAEILARHPGHTQGDLNTAGAYYEINKEEVDRLIRGNQEA